MPHGPTGQRLRVKGHIRTTLSYKGRACEELVFIVVGLKTNLLGLPATRALSLHDCHGQLHWWVHREKKLTSSSQNCSRLGVTYHIKLRSDAQTFVLFTARNVPLTLHSKWIGNHKYESAGVIPKVTIPIPWCASSPKLNGNVRICVDLNAHVRTDSVFFPRGSGK